MRYWEETLRDYAPELQKNIDVFPGSDVAAFRSPSGEPMRWGMVPPWSKEFKSDPKYPTHLARIESVSERKTYAKAWNNKQRCIIPMAGYYEWTGPKGAKTKWYVTNKDTDGLVVAGLWDAWGAANELSCTMISRQADPFLAEVNHRMLVYLSPANANSWLNGEMTQEQAQDLELPNVIFFPDSQR